MKSADIASAPASERISHQGRQRQDVSQRNEPSTPRTGESGKQGQPFNQASESGFDRPPQGQEYRVVNDHLVLVDTSKFRIVKVLGLLNNLTD
ncbi:hypothetical protein E4191_16870 (plasmid) [Paracoccus liaowanqingii]|uniref:Uncharacterized protein n=1 Tax=Paracoccus liaowanqingii TaxID=2560053 RepID=A0A4Y5SQP9_9RHOB|nr:hypothetical protein [Paracoccus liaowanqingii]QDA35832.1 hypothetical protein E4191_16870 [Paracoccus liaowanqingii]